MQSTMMIAMGAALSIGSANAETCTDEKTNVWINCIEARSTRGPIKNCDTAKEVAACGALNNGTGVGGYPGCTEANTVVYAVQAYIAQCDNVSAVAPGLLSVAAAFIASKFL